MTLLGDGSPLLLINQNVARPFSSAILRFNGQNGGLKKPIVPERDLTDPSADPNVPFASRGTMVLSAKKVLFVPDRHRADLECPSNLPTGRVVMFTENGAHLGAHRRSQHRAPGAVPSRVHRARPRRVALRVQQPESVHWFGWPGVSFDPETLMFKDVFIIDNGGAGQLNRPAGLVFDPDGHKLYVLSFRDNGQPNTPGNADAIRIYNATTGAFQGKIDLWQVVVPPTDPAGCPTALLCGGAPLWTGRKALRPDQWRC